MGGNSNWRGPVWCLSENLTWEPTVDVGYGCRQFVHGGVGTVQVSHQLPSHWVVAEVLSSVMRKKNTFFQQSWWWADDEPMMETSWRFHQYYGDEYLIEFPTGSGQKVGLCGQSQDNCSNVNPGLINPKRLFNWGDTMQKYQMKWLFGEYPPN